MFQFIAGDLTFSSLSSNPIIFIVVIIAVMFGLTYFTSVRPQKKREKTHQEMLTQLSKGDKIMTIGGFIAKIYTVKDDSIIVELLPNNVLAEISKEAIRTKIEE